LEEDYKSKYKGFDPKSVDSYIMFEFMQDKYIDKSVDFSSSIQNQFVNFCHRANHGVRQAGFWVLHRSACPSVLVELGFISNSSEERYLTSDHGQKEMATAIYNAFIDYKRIYDRRSGRQNKNVSKIESIAKDDDSNQNHFTKSDEDQKNTRETKRTTKEINSEKSNSSTADSDQLPVFKVQLFATVKTLGPNAPDFKGVSDVEYFEERGLKKYTLGAETDYSKIEQIRLEILHKFPDAFIIAFIGDRKLTPKEVLKLSK
jgi:N-acetylmuramoyl-L-alanine amidase